jgi:hypothetical protein
MENKGVEWDDIQSGNWNVAKPYTQEKILKWLVLIDEYQTIATFGFSKIESDVFINNENLKNTSRLHAMKRLIHSIVSLIRNTKFAVKKNDMKSFEDHTKRLLLIEKSLYKLREEKKRGNKITELGINEKLFDLMMKEISEIIDDINQKLNDADLIFTHTEDIDPKKIKEGYIEKYINRG